LQAAKKVPHPISRESLLWKITVRAEMSAEGNVQVEIFNL